MVWVDEGINSGVQRWRRSDGAIVKWNNGPSKLNWIAYEPDPSEKYLSMGNGRLTWLRRWKTPEAAMRAVDREYPLPAHPDNGAEVKRE